MKWRSLFGILCLSCGLSSTLWAWGRTEWQGVEAYRSKHYKKAAKVFSQIDSPWAWYNEANA
ncbi:MAG: hypothetical protein Q8R79_02195, partial [Legionellaceae bacterium]|nr:hypothetical protein [Legionellaceae bacterium]